MPFELIRFWRRNEAPETSNIAGLSLLAGRLANTKDDRGQMGNLIQSIHSARLGNIKAPVCSNNHLTTVYHCQGSDNRDYAEIKVRDIILKKELQSGDTHHKLGVDQTLHEAGRIRVYNGYIYKDSSQPMIVHKYEGLALKDWKRDLDVFSAVSGHQHSLRDYHLSLPGPSFVTYAYDLSAADALHTQGLRPARYMPVYNVDHAGQLVVHTFAPRRSYDGAIFLGVTLHQSDKDIQRLFSRYQSDKEDMRRLFSRFHPNSFTKSLLEEYYDLLAVICEMHGFITLTNFNASMMHQEGTTTLHVSRPYILRLDNQHPEEDPVLCECMPDMSIRCTVPTSDLVGLQFHQCLAFGVQSTASGLTSTPVFRIFNLWASQVNHLIKQMKTNDMEVQTSIPQGIVIYYSAAPRMPRQSAGAAHEFLQYTLLYLWVQCTPSSNTWRWSIDLEGQTTISAMEIEDRFNISLDIKINMFEYHIPWQIYQILWDIHKACGFNPDSTEIAEYLRYPLLEPVLEPASVHADLYEEECLESDDYLSDEEVVTQENKETGSDNESENGSTSSNDTFVSAASDV